MLSNIRKVSKGPLGYSLRLLVSSLGLVFVVAACGGPETVTPSPRTPDAESVAPKPTAPATLDTEIVAHVPTAPATPDVESTAPAPAAVPTPESGSVTPTPSQSDMPDTASVAPAPAAPPTLKAESVTPAPAAPVTPDAESTVPAPAAPDAESVAPAPVPSDTPDTESVAPEATPTYSAHPPAHYGAATPSVEERIYDSDVIIRASLQSSETDSLRFRAIEYLKGAGPADIVVLAPTYGRNTAWDDHEAVLFLSLPEDQATSGAAGAAGGEVLPGSLFSPRPMVSPIQFMTIETCFQPAIR